MFRVRAHCKEGFPTYKYFSSKFTHTVSCLKKLIGKTELKNEKFEELEKHAMFFKERELELMVYMDDDEWKTIRAKFVSAQGQEKNRVALREDLLEQTVKRESKVTTEILEKDMFQAILNKTFMCILASKDQQKLNDIAKYLYHSGLSMEDNQTNGILFYDTKAHMNVSLTEMVNGNFKFTDAKSSFTEEMGSLYTRVESVLISRIKYILRLMLEFLTAHLPLVSKEELVDLFEMEKYVTEYVEEIKGLWKTRYEVLGWIRCAKINIGVQMPEAPKLPENLQRELLRLEGVEGCGTIWGRLTLVVTADKVQDIEMLVPKILHKHTYNYQHRVMVFLKTELHAGGIEAGAKLNVKLTEDGKRKLREQQKGQIQDKIIVGDCSLGTLGCFVINKQKSASPDTNTSPDDIYGITCEHVVSDCYGDVNVGYAKISSIDETISMRKGDAVDIAAMKITKNGKKCCKLELPIESRQDVSVASADDYRKWRFYDGEAGDIDLHERAVFKKGSESNITHGLVICNNYRTKLIEELVQKQLYAFDDLFNILIEVKPGSDKGTEFSKSGDSGAAVCSERPSDDMLEVISLLQGSIYWKSKDSIVEEDETPNPLKDGTPNGNRKPNLGETGKGAEGLENNETRKKDGKLTYVCSYSTHMKKSLHHLGRGAIFDVPVF